MNEKEKERLLIYYCENDMSRLKSLTNNVLFSMGRGNQNDLDDFYSIANEELWKAVESYNPDNEFGAKFETYLSVILKRKFNTEFAQRTRIKRGRDIKFISLEQNKSGLENISVIDTVASNENLEKEVLGENSKVDDYLQSLSKKELRVAELVMQGFTIKEITEELSLKKKEIENRLKSMRCYEKRMKLSDTVNVLNNGEGNTMNNQNNKTMEKAKRTSYNVETIINRMVKRTINFEHPLQRYAGQWSNKMKSDLVSDILQGNPIPGLIFAEQVINGCAIIFDLDGKQRCTTVKEFKEDSFKISKNVSRNMISYQHYERTEEGQPVVDSNGYPIVTWMEYDISNKKYSQLPEELKELFDTYSFDVTLYLNCSDEDVAYHIQRYNQGKPMNGMQKGITKLGEDYARKVKEISAMPFFRDTEFTFKQTINGTTERVVIESIMAINFLDDWKKSPEDIAIYVDKNATFEMFENIEDSIFRLQDIISEKSSELFNAKNTFLWLAIFEKFKNLNIDDSIFNDFLEKFKDELQYRKIDKYTFVNIDEGKNTKDKQLLIRKLNHLEKLLMDYIYDKDEV